MGGAGREFRDQSRTLYILGKSYIPGPKLSFVLFYFEFGNFDPLLNSMQNFICMHIYLRNLVS